MRRKGPLFFLYAMQKREKVDLYAWREREEKRKKEKKVGILGNGFGFNLCVFVFLFWVGFWGVVLRIGKRTKGGI